MDNTVRTLSPQESRVVLSLAEQKRREVDRAGIIGIQTPTDSFYKTAETVKTSNSPKSGTPRVHGGS